MIEEGSKAPVPESLRVKALDVTAHPMSERSCPACSESMSTGRLGPIALDLCLKCSGVWFDCGELSQIITAGPHVLRRLCAKLPPEQPANKNNAQAMATTATLDRGT